MSLTKCLYPQPLKQDVNRFRPCGSCMPCRIRKREEWTTRILLEMTSHCHNAFVTLTYSDSNLPTTGSVNKRALQLWLKRLRRFLEPTRIRYFACGEYGSRTMRPHYHACLFGLPRESWDLIGKSWDLGFTTVSELTPERARYTAQYTTKKLIGRGSYDDGRSPEFMISSRRPGLGTRRLEMIGRDLKRPDGLPRDDLNQWTTLFGKRHNLDRFSRQKIADIAGSESEYWKWLMQVQHGAQIYETFDKAEADRREKAHRRAVRAYNAKSEKI